MTLIRVDRLPTPLQIKKRHLLYAVLALFVLGTLSFALFRPILVLPRIGLAAGFSLIDQNGNRLTNEDLRGQIVLYNFTYTYCAPPCSQTTPVMAEVQSRLAELDNPSGLPITLVTISFDPERDSSAVLQQFASQWTANQANWHFLTGEASALKWVIGGGFSVFYQMEQDGNFTFDPALMLVDGAGILRAEYRTATPEVERLLRDMQLIVTEVNNSKGASRVAYEAAHLFLCYPR